MKNKKAFTLIELLIVVVIIGVLAALILPRMLAQPERARIAEAMQYLGVIRRSQEANAQPGTTYLSATSGDPTVSPVVNPNASWTQLGLSPLAPATSFIYACTTGTVDVNPAAGANTAVGTAGTCTATRLGAGGARSAGTITMNIANGFISGCGGPPAAGNTAPYSPVGGVAALGTANGACA